MTKLLALLPVALLLGWITRGLWEHTPVTFGTDSTPLYADQLQALRDTRPESPDILRKDRIVVQPNDSLQDVLAKAFPVSNNPRTMDA